MYVADTYVAVVDAVDVNLLVRCDILYAIASMLMIWFRCECSRYVAGCERAAHRCEANYEDTTPRSLAMAWVGAFDIRNMVR